MRPYLLGLMLLGLAACNQQGNTAKDTADSGKLSPTLVQNPRTANGIDTAKARSMPTMDFADTLHNFKTINEGEQVVHEFAFTNNGKSPLIITSAVGSCGCTIAEYPHDPILPGKGGVMKVVFNSTGKYGHQEKSVTVSTNTLRGTHKLYIQGEVAGDEKHPVNH